MMPFNTFDMYNPDYVNSLLSQACYAVSDYNQVEIYLPVEYQDTAFEYIKHVGLSIQPFGLQHKGLQAFRIRKITKDYIQDYFKEFEK